MTFEEWMKIVDLFVYRLAGVSVYDLPDQTFMIWFKDGVKPSTAAKRALRDAGWRR